MDLVLFGIQGSGKGTQAKLLASASGYRIFEAGSALRSIAASGSALGAVVASHIDQGHLVPFPIIMQVVEQAISVVPKNQPLLFDGIPRDLDQQREFDVLMDRLGRAFRCIHLTAPEPVVMERLRKRAVEQGRVDDASDEAIMRRINLFKEKTVPVIEAYRNEGILTDIDGDGTVDEVAARLKEAIKPAAAGVER